MKNYLPDTEHIRPIGRSFLWDGIRYLGWSGSGAEFVFTGTVLQVDINTDWENDESWKCMFQPWAAVFVDGGLSMRFHIYEGTNSYTVYKSDEPRTVTIRIVKLSEAAFNKIGIVNICADGDIRPTVPPERRIEFIGDSITCGFGIEGKSAEERFHTDTENPCKTYAALTAEHFGAEYNLISWSSIGVYSSSCDEDAANPADEWVMPMLYDYTDIGSSNTFGFEPERWNFNSFVPDVIVLNLGTNDSSYTKGLPERVNAFKKAYGSFLRHIREKNPDSYIICTLGMMGNALGNTLFPAVEETVRETGDKKIFSLELDEQLASDGIGCENHPNAVTHRKAAEKLAKKISAITGWQDKDKK